MENQEDLLQNEARDIVKLLRHLPTEERLRIEGVILGLNMAHSLCAEPQKACQPWQIPKTTEKAENQCTLYTEN